MKTVWLKIFPKIFFVSFKSQFIDILSKNNDFFIQCTNIMFKDYIYLRIAKYYRTVMEKTNESSFSNF